MEYLIHILILASIYGILALSLNLVVGYAGLVSLCSAAFYGIGAYAAALILTKTGFSFAAGALLGSGLAIVVSAAAGLVLARFRDDYYMIVSLGFVNIATGVFVNWTDMTGGPFGVAGIPRPEIFGISLSSQGSFLVLSIFVLLATAAFSRWIVTSSFGRALAGIREDEIAMQVFGYKTGRYTLLVFVISALCAAWAGALYASYASFIDPGTFNLNESIVILSMIIVGGLASIRGSLAGSLVLIVIPEALRFAGFPSSLAGQARELVFGALLVLLMLYRPKGFFGAYRL